MRYFNSANVLFQRTFLDFNGIAMKQYEVEKHPSLCLPGFEPKKKMSYRSQYRAQIGFNIPRILKNIKYN